MLDTAAKPWYHYGNFNMENAMITWDEDNFMKFYKGSEAFVRGEAGYYALFLELIGDEELLAHIKFANDVLGIPPLRSFVLFERDACGREVFRAKLSAAAKRGLGSCFGYLYKVVYGGYTSEQCWFNDEETGIKTASRFLKI